MKPIGAFISHKALKEYGSRLLEEYGVEYVHTHLPVFPEEARELYNGVRCLPENFEKESYADLKRLVEEFRGVGLNFFASYPVFSRPEIARRGPEYSTWTILGKPHYDRACPTNPDVLRRIVADLRSLVRLYGVEGIVLDFIRFESPMAGLDYFLTCFCPSCCEEMKRLGYDPVSIRRDLLGLTDFLGKGGFSEEIVRQGALSTPDVLDLYNEFPGVFEWFRYRNDYIENVVKTFASAVKEEGGRGTVVGANLLSPWWSLLAGQSYRALSNILDIIEPMLYFDWMQWEGLTAVKELSRAYGVDKDVLSQFYYVATGLNTIVKPRNYDETRLSGLPSSSIEAGLRKISYWNVGKARIWPVVLVLRTDSVHYLLGERISNISMAGREFFVESVKSAARGRADGIVYWNFDGADKDVIQELYAVWRTETP
ncbi:MAG: hypothetical protein ACPL4E_09415 [Thermoproteota archaeon]